MSRFYYQEGNVPNELTKYTGEFNFDKVYFASSIDFDCTNKVLYLTHDQLFITPYKGIASIFIANRQDYDATPNVTNIGYDEWKLPIDQLNEVFDTVHVNLEGDPDIREHTIKTTGFIYTIKGDIVKNHLYTKPWMDKDREFIVSGITELPIINKEQITNTRIIKGVNKVIKEGYSLDYFSMRFNNINDKKDEDVDIITESDNITQEAMFDVGFGNLRAGLANALKNCKVTNIFKGMGGKDKFDIIGDNSEDGDESIKTSVESTGTGAKVVTRDNESHFKCHFMNIPLSQALNKILELFQSPDLLLEGAMINMSRFGGKMFYEDGEKTEEDDDGDLDEAPSLDDIDVDSDDDDSNKDTEAGVEDAGPEDEAGDDASVDEEIDLSKFGTDNSDVQNEYDPNELDMLNALIADEQHATGRYFDAIMNTRKPSLVRLYTDIGNEERYHAEQLLFAKAQMTGEHYEPTDDKVKEEYNKLIELGMDTETAASTAIDKVSMMNVHDTDNNDDSDMEKIEQECVFIEEALLQNEILLQISEAYISAPMVGRNAAIGVFVEQYFQEYISNQSQPISNVKLDNPITLLTKGLSLAINALHKLARIIEDTMKRNKYKRMRKHEWIAKHGIAGLFKSGIHLYFYDDTRSIIDIENPVRYIDMMYRLTVDTASSCKIKLTEAAKHKPVKNPIRYSNIADGMNKLKGIIMNKTKVIVTDNNKDVIANIFFGYSNNKLTVKTKHPDLGDTPDKSFNNSSNIYSRMELMSAITSEYSKVALAVLQHLQKFEGDTNSIFYKNRKLYDTSVNNMKIIVNRYKEFIQCMISDMNAMLHLDNGLLKQTREHDEADSKGIPYTGNQNGTTGGKLPKDNNGYTK